MMRTAIPISAPGGSGFFRRGPLPAGIVGPSDLPPVRGLDATSSMPVGTILVPQLVGTAVGACYGAIIGSVATRGFSGALSGAVAGAGLAALQHAGLAAYARQWAAAAVMTGVVAAAAVGTAFLWSRR